MIEFGLGVQFERSFYIYKIDQDRFDEDSFKSAQSLFFIT
jgi:restriction system protein